MVGSLAILIDNKSGSDYRDNNLKYFGSKYGSIVRIVYQFEDGTYLTNCFLPEFVGENNDYIFNGFLKVMRHDVFTSKDLTSIGA